VKNQDNEDNEDNEEDKIKDDEISGWLNQRKAICCQIVALKPLNSSSRGFVSFSSTFVESGRNRSTVSRLVVKRD